MGIDIDGINDNKYSSHLGIICINGHLHLIIQVRAKFHMSIDIVHSNTSYFVFIACCICIQLTLFVTIIQSFDVYTLQFKLVHKSTLHNKRHC